jgi:hypothetical protein
MKKEVKNTDISSALHLQITGELTVYLVTLLFEI